MKQKSRTEYSVMNTTVAFLAQTLAIFMCFFTRVVFTRTLSEGYVGINGLFTDILNKYIVFVRTWGRNSNHICSLRSYSQKRYKKTTDPDADVSEFLQDNSGLCCACRLMPDTIFGYFDEGSSRCESSDYNLSSVSA